MTETGATPAPGPRAWIDSVAIAVATAGGAGYFPKAPGTMGSFVGAVVYVLFALASLDWAYLAAIALLALAGVWSAARVEPIYGHDASRIVIDEVVGQMLTLAFVTRGDVPGLAIGTILGFLLFRFFDILKPFPVRGLERLPGGVGVMADDLGAAAYAFLALLVLEPLASRMASIL